MRLLLLALLFSTAANAETWQCSSGQINYSDDNVLIMAVINDDRETGGITVAGVTHKTTFQVLGFNRVWGFQSFLFSISPDGDGIYYEADGKGLYQPRDRFSCRQK